MISPMMSNVISNVTYKAYAEKCLRRIRCVAVFRPYSHLKRGNLSFGHEHGLLGNKRVAGLGRNINQPMLLVSLMFGLASKTVCFPTNCSFIV